jgi:hypothetical protein
MYVNAYFKCADKLWTLLESLSMAEEGETMQIGLPIREQDSFFAPLTPVYSIFVTFVGLGCLFLNTNNIGCHL